MMRMASVCSGIGGAEVAFHGLAQSVFAAEINPFARAMLSCHFPDLPIYGDFTEIEADAGPVDILVGGTPCQSFSVAGLRGGMADARGNLALEFLRLAERLRARWVLWENVPGVLSSSGGRDFGAFLGGLAELGYGFCYRVLDAQYFGLAQRRKRVFVVGHLGDWRRAASVLLEPASLRWHPPPRREAREEVAAALTRGADSSGVANPIGAKRRDDLDNDTYITFGGNNTPGAIDIATAVRAHGSFHGDFESETFVTHSLRANGFDASEDGTGRGTLLVTGLSSVRRLTPLECEALQGYPLGWTDIEYRGKRAADGPRYRALGNAFPVPVVRWIARRIASNG